MEYQGPQSAAIENLYQIPTDDHGDSVTPMDHDGEGIMNEANTSPERMPVEAPTHERSESNDQIQPVTLPVDELVRSSQLKPC